MELALLRKILQVGALSIGLFVYVQIISTVCLAIYLILLRDDVSGSNVTPAIIPLILLTILSIVGIALSTTYFRKKFNLENKFTIAIVMLFLLVAAYSIYVGFNFVGSAIFFYRGLYELNPTIPHPSYIADAFWWNWWPR